LRTKNLLKFSQNQITMETIVKIQKEDVVNLKFPDEEVLLNEDEKIALRKQLEQATTLGNGDHGKIKIFFKDNEGSKQVETTIWATGEKNIVLKQGITIPIKRILGVEMI
jgi:uncharacterized protein (UPF0248 family)